MRTYVWVVIVVAGVFLLASIVIPLCIIFYKLYRFRQPKHTNSTMCVQPSTATPISVFESAHKESSLELPPPSYERNGGVRIRNSAPPIVTLSNDVSLKREKLRELNENNWAAQRVYSISTASAESADRTNTSTFSLRHKRSTAEFVDRDPPSAESKLDYLDPLDFGKLPQLCSDCQISSEKKRPQFNSVECIYREDHRYLHT